MINNLKKYNMTQEQFEAITKWQRETFGQATALSKLEHLKQEIEELIEAIKTNDQNKRHEFADCLILLFGAASSDGMTYEDICNAIAEKMEINYQRKWGKPDENGVVNHVRE